MDSRLLCNRFPRTSQYNPDWLIASAGSGANTLWLTEWLCQALDLRPGMRVLDLGCGRAVDVLRPSRLCVRPQPRVKDFRLGGVLNKTAV